MVLATPVSLKDGRRLIVEWPGAADGLTIVVCHGTPGSARWHPSPAHLARAADLGLRLMTVSRPGYGGSDRLPGRSVASWADDVAQLVGQLRLGADFALIGVSGGGPHALACGQLPGVRAVAVLAGLGPLAGDDAFEGMAASTAALWRSAFDDDGLLESTINSISSAMRRGDPSIVADRALDRYPTSAVQFLASHPELRAGMIDDLVAAFADGGWGWLDDARAFRSNWGFSPADITVPVWMAHGDHDEFVPLHHAQQLNAELPQATLRIVNGNGHMDLIDNAFNDAIDWIHSIAAQA